MYYTKVDQEKCIACGLCQIKAPQVFNYNEEGIAYTISDNNKGILPLPTDVIPHFKEAYQACPTGAIVRRTTTFSIE
ncbi:ferredoxin [Carnobacterium divergens]|uniref:ferredoxin n=1 Tax=Carnobacterium divergens TaxID=2748 RepID=UPI0010716985|nr:ferredoxin [Carnobacterium divergens]TFI70596.1 ferredoxin [Carnobacterium divergens]